jgi:hypothetical protein
MSRSYCEVTPLRPFPPWTLLLGHQKAAGYFHDCAGDVAGLFRGKKDHDARLLFRHCKSTHRISLFALLQPFRMERKRPLRAGRERGAGHCRVDRDALPCNLKRKMFREADHPGLCGGVSRTREAHR